MNKGAVRFTSSLSAWAFGLATTVLLLSFWGRAVVIDTAELSDNLRPLGESDEVTGRFSDWMTNQLVDSGVPQPQAGEATQLALFTPEVKLALANLVGEVVDAASVSVQEEAAVDMASIFSPAVPAVSASLASQGVPATEAQVGGIVEGLDPLVIREPGEEPLVGPVSPVASRLGAASLLAIIGQVIFGAVYVIAAESRVRAMRTLLTRFAVGGLTFALLLKAGSWALDPGGGGAPVSESLSRLAGSKWLLPWSIGVAAAIGALFFWLIRATGGRAARPEAVSQPTF
ncbi:MAG TPA: hypothetical protein VMO52_06485 [Acidimicrobiia bacterium]|nr:hypothetical protein [Acidimicrobiia bacterium]